MYSCWCSHVARLFPDKKIIRDQLLNILLAGRDTTSCLLTYVTYAMAMYPDIARKMREEVLQHCGSTQSPTFEKIKALRYGAFSFCIASSATHHTGFSHERIVKYTP